VLRLVFTVQLPQAPPAKPPGLVLPMPASLWPASASGITQVPVAMSHAKPLGQGVEASQAPQRPFGAQMSERHSPGVVQGSPFGRPQRPSVWQMVERHSATDMQGVLLR
jgi:hypothetical protein